MLHKEKTPAVCEEGIPPEAVTSRQFKPFWLLMAKKGLMPWATKTAITKDQKGYIELNILRFKV